MTNKAKKLYLGCPVTFTDARGEAYGAFIAHVISEDCCDLQAINKTVHGLRLELNVPRQRDLDAPAIPHSWRWSPGS